MTRKDYVALASAIKRAKDAYRDTLEAKAIYLTAEEVAFVCKQDNPRFDHVRFMQACGF